MSKCLIVCLILAQVSLDHACAQISQGGTPYSFSIDQPMEELSTLELPVRSMDDVHAEDLQRMDYARIAYPIEVDFTLKNAGHWTELEDGGQLWRLKVKSPGALTMHVLYDEFWLPPGAKFFVYNELETQILGAYTNANNKHTGKFATQMIYGDCIVLELYEPKEMVGKSEIGIFRFNHGYQNQLRPDQTKGVQEVSFSTHNRYSNQPGSYYGNSWSCHENINCSPQDAWYWDVKRSVGMYLRESTEGTYGACSGALLNNTSGNKAPYFLTAFHCLRNNASGGSSFPGTPLFEYFMFFFNYEAPGCTTPSTSSSDYDYILEHTKSIVGCFVRAEHKDSDFALLEIANRIPSDFNVFFSGWDRQVHNSSELDDSGFSIHHPVSDIKKFASDEDDISLENSTITNSSVVSPRYPYHYWRSSFLNDVGSIQSGSSGAPLFKTSNKRIVGQLSGEANNGECLVIYELWGAFHKSWDKHNAPSTCLKYWLDPLGSNITSIDGIEGNVCVTNFHLVNPVGSFPDHVRDKNFQLKYEADNSIVCSAIIDERANVAFDAGQHIVLTNGFHAKPRDLTSPPPTPPFPGDKRARFHAYIDGCGNLKRSPYEVHNAETADEYIDFSISPNPTSGVLQVSTPDAEGFQVSISTLAGVIVIPQYALKSNVESIDLNHLPTGVYIVTLHHGDKHYSSRVIKE